MATRNRIKGTHSTFPFGGKRGTCGASGFTASSGSKAPGQILVPTPWGSTYTAVRNDEESMTDVIGNRGGVNAVTHNILAIEPVDDSYTVEVFNKPGTRLDGKCTVEFVGNNAALTAYNRSAHLGPFSNGSAIAQQRIPAFSREVMSGLNSLYELKDVASSLSAIALHLLHARKRALAKMGREPKMKYVARQMMRDWKTRSLQQLKSRPLDVIKDLVGLDLSWKFGWSPFIGDVQKVHSVMGAVDKKLGRLQSKPFSVAGTYRETRSDTYVEATGGDACPTGSSLARVHTVRTTTKTWVAGVRRTLNPSAFQSPDLAKLHLLREQLGMSLEAKDIWEAMPYSFIVDWFMPVQEFIEQFGNREPDPSWFTTHSTWRSEKTVTDGRTIVQRYQSLFTIFEVVKGLPHTSECAFKRTTYTRSASAVSAPALFIPRPRMPSLGQWWTGAELFFQRLK